MTRIGYARVSSVDQDLDIQTAKLKAEGCEIIRSEKVSGGSREGRTELAIIIEFLRPGDEMVVTASTDWAAIPAMERRFIKERQREGIQRAKNRGAYAGGKRRLDRTKVRVLHVNGLRATEIAAQLGCPRMQIYRILNAPE